MTEFARVSRVFAQGADTVWAEVRRFSGIAAWVDGVSACELEGEGVGAIRHVVRQGRHVREALRALDEAGRRLSYDVLEPHSLPARKVRATLEVEPVEGGGCRVTWWAQADLDGRPDVLRCAIEPFYAASLANLATRLEGAEAA